MARKMKEARDPSLSLCMMGNGSYQDALVQQYLAGIVHGRIDSTFRSRLNSPGDSTRSRRRHVLFQQLEIVSIGL